MDSDQVKDRADFLEFISGLRAELASGGEDWENIDLPTYLEAMARWVKDWHGYLSDNPCQHAAMLLEVAAIYE